MKRFEVSEWSMAPGLRPGDEVVATDSISPVPGDVVVFEHPARADFWLIKRLADDDGRVLSDNREIESVDSRSFGSISPARMLTVVDRLDPVTFAEACDLLVSEEPALEDIIERWGRPDFWQRSPGFATLALLILEQQVSLESGAAMFRRLADLVDDVAPEGVLDAGEGSLRSIGVTRQKAGYLIELAEAVVTGDLDLDHLADAGPSHARAALMGIKGIGSWTADAYLLSALRLTDVWPVGDRALQVGCGELLGMSSPPDEIELELIAEPWRPVRAAAARLVWHAYLSERGRVEPDTT